MTLPYRGEMSPEAMDLEDQESIFESNSSHRSGSPSVTTTPTPTAIPTRDASNELTDHTWSDLLVLCKHPEMNETVYFRAHRLIVGEWSGKLKTACERVGKATRNAELRCELGPCQYSDIMWGSR